MMMYTAGSSIALALSLPGRHTGPSSLALSPSSHGSEYGNLGHPKSVKPSSGWLLGTGVGQLIGFKKEDSPTQLIAPYVIRKMRMCSTS